MGAPLYEPINVYKPVAPNIGIVDGPFEYLTVAGVKMPIPFTTRMTVVRLTNGNLFLHSPIKFDDRLANELQGLGTPRHLVSPNQFHYAHIGEWQRPFPKRLPGHRRVSAKGPARSVSMLTLQETSRPVRRRMASRNRPDAFSRWLFQGVRFLPQASKALILTDTIINIELDKVTEPWRTATKLTGMYHSYGQIFFGMRLPLLLKRRKAKAALGKIHSWQPQRILLSHGRCFDAHADEVIRGIFGEPPH